MEEFQKAFQLKPGSAMVPAACRMWDLHDVAPIVQLYAEEAKLMRTNAAYGVALLSLVLTSVGCRPDNEHDVPPRAEAADAPWVERGDQPVTVTGRLTSGPARRTLS